MCNILGDTATYSCLHTKKMTGWGNHCSIQSVEIQMNH